MSSPEKQQPPKDISRADSLRSMDLTFCRLHIERLLEEANILGSLEVVDSYEMALDVDLPSTRGYASTEDTAPYKMEEAVTFNVRDEADMVWHKIRHATVVEAQGGVTQYMGKDYRLLFDRNDEGKLVLNLFFSQYKVETHSISDLHEGFKKLHNEGSPLLDEQKEILAASAKDIGEIKSFQLNEISDLAQRALASVRQDLTR